MKKIAIIGAGISGLFVANLFKENLDYQVAIYEKNTSINLDKGYGIQLSTNSIKLLNTIGFNTLESKDRFSPENGVDEFLEVGGDVNVEYVKIWDMDDIELWRDPEYKEDT